MATVFMSVYGKQGLRELAAAEPRQGALPGDGLPLEFSGPFFNEFVVRTNGRTPAAVNEALLERRSSAGCRWAASIRNWKAACCCAPPRWRAREQWTRAEAHSLR
jgi:glycine cleavage system pyridoxal-binding protein P